ncbi:MAG: Transcriptional regulator, XRE family [Desulfotomaculum sp. 46_296]|nr:MAG: Transcriptional regulator, XRE family [Desulfotomaculum sp. 46_296]HAU31807.1 transcriptional regulator [Desulfotomaculum sp.]
MALDEILKKIRTELNLTQEQLARELNVSFSTLNRWENSRTVPSRLARMRMLDYCAKNGVSAEVISELKRAK